MPAPTRAHQALMSEKPHCFARPVQRMIGRMADALSYAKRSGEAFEDSFHLA
jgi:hypothetical protein